LDAKRLHLVGIGALRVGTRTLTIAEVEKANSALIWMNMMVEGPVRRSNSVYLPPQQLLAQPQASSIAYTRAASMTAFGKFSL